MKSSLFFRKFWVASLFLFISLFSSKIIFAVEKIDDLSRAYGFYLGQETSIELCTKKCPYLENIFRNNAFEFNIKFESAIKNIEKKLKSVFKDKWSEFQNDLLKTMRDHFQKNQFNCDSCKQFIEILKARTKGEMPLTILRVYLQYHPKYVKNPELEVADSFFGEYKTEGKKKALGIKLGVAYPLSWTPKDARAPHIIKKFVGLDTDKILPQCMVYVNKLPSDIQEEMKLYDRDKIVEMWSGRDFIEETVKDSEYISSGKTKIAGEPASWVKFSNVQESPLGKFYACRLIYNIMYKEYVVQIQFGVSDMKKNSKQGAMKAMDKYEMLFKLLASKLYIYNKFDY